MLILSHNEVIRCLHVCSKIIKSRTAMIIHPDRCAAFVTNTQESRT